MKELKRTSSSFRLRSRLVEFLRLCSYFILMLFAVEVMDDFLPTIWVVAWLTLNFFLIDWILYRFCLLPAAELEIQKKTERSEG
jgi:hypothetical protein